MKLERELLVIRKTGFLWRKFGVFTGCLQAGIGGADVYVYRTSPLFVSWFMAARWLVNNSRRCI
jgi:hypothetical protein